jgi:hypothetical protein
MINAIRQRAHEIYLERQRTGQYLIFDKGEVRECTALDDWIEAEAQIKNEKENQWLYQG